MKSITKLLIGASLGAAAAAFTLYMVGPVRQKMFLKAVNCAADETVRTITKLAKEISR